MTIALLNFILTAIAIAGPALVWIKTQKPGTISLPTLAEMASKLQHLDIVTLQKWVDTVQGITHDQRLTLLSMILGKINDMKNGIASPPVGSVSGVILPPLPYLLKGREHLWF